MELSRLKLHALGLSDPSLGRILSIVDFGNVTYWFHRDQIGPDASPLLPNQRLTVDLKRLYDFISEFSYQARFYYGWHPRLTRSQHLVIKADRIGYVKNTKRIQYVRHYLADGEAAKHERSVRRDTSGAFIEIPKCNFDVEIAIDAIRLMQEYDTLCLFSGDSDFARLAQYIKKRGKKVVVIASGQVYHELRRVADRYINAQQIKAYVVAVKETTPR